MTSGGKNRITYKDAGVDITAGDALVDRIAPAARATARPGADAALGGFGALFDLKAAGFKDPLIVSSTDGVGTKLMIAIEMNRFDTIGQDLVAMCVNDIVVQGAQPLFFLDYFATGALDIDAAAQVIEGIAKACKETGCALIGGETAEMPDLYAKGHFDLAGFSVGAVERNAVLPRTDMMHAGDVLIGVASSGVHSNGYSLVRRVVKERGFSYAAPSSFAPGKTLGDVLIEPTRLYVKSGLAAMQTGAVKGFAHITGGGITENLPRVLPDGLDGDIDLSTWQRPAVFSWLMSEANLDHEEMLRTFNCGVGLIAVVSSDKSGRVIEAFGENGERAFRIGSLVRGGGKEPVVHFRGVL